MQRMTGPEVQQIVNKRNERLLTQLYAPRPVRRRSSPLPMTRREYVTAATARAVQSTRVLPRY